MGWTLLHLRNRSPTRDSCSNGTSTDQPRRQAMEESQNESGKDGRLTRDERALLSRMLSEEEHKCPICGQVVTYGDEINFGVIFDEVTHSAKLVFLQSQLASRHLRRV